MKRIHKVHEETNGSHDFREQTTISSSFKLCSKHYVVKYDDVIPSCFLTYFLTGLHVKTTKNRKEELSWAEPKLTTKWLLHFKAWPF